jgi:Flp pilus assembly protein TadB
MTGIIEAVKGIMTFNLQIFLFIIGLFISLMAGFAAYYVTLNAEARRYARRLREVSDEVYVTIVRALDDGVVPSRLLITSAINSISREEGLAKGDYPPANDVIEDVITGIMGSDFLSQEKRRELIKQLAERLIEEDVFPEPTVKGGLVAEVKKNKINIALAFIIFLLCLVLIIFSLAAGSTLFMYIMPAVILVLILATAVYFWATGEKKLEFIAIEEEAAGLIEDAKEAFERAAEKKPAAAKPEKPKEKQPK